MDDREAEEEVSRGNPAGCDSVFAEEGYDDRAAAEDDSAGKIERGEEGEGLGCVADDDVKGDGEDESDEEENYDCCTEGPGHGGYVAC